MELALSIALLTISDRRTRAEDTSGDALEQRLTAAAINSMIGGSALMIAIRSVQNSVNGLPIQALMW